jgi:hypothetical protein
MRPGRLSTAVPQKRAGWHSSAVKRHRLGSEGCLSIALTPALADGKVPEGVAMRDDATWCNAIRSAGAVSVSGGANPSDLHEHSDGVVYRVCRELQRQFLDPPDLDGHRMPIGGKYG